MQFLYPKGIELQPDGEEEEDTFSGADDGKRKPTRVAKFTKYFKKNSENGATVLREECRVRRFFCVCVCVFHCMIEQLWIFLDFVCVLFLFILYTYRLFATSQN